MTAQQVIDQLGLIPLPQEGGMHLQTYISRQTIEGQQGRAAGTAIYYLLTPGTFSHLHRLDGDEVYHFYLGDPVEMLELLPDGTARRTILGQDLLHGQQVQHLVPAGNWQGSHLLGERASDGSMSNACRMTAAAGSPDQDEGACGFALLGTTMCPGYSQDGYEHGSRNELLAAYPDARDLILELTG